MRTGLAIVAAFVAGGAQAAAPVSTPAAAVAGNCGALDGVAYRIERAVAHDAVTASAGPALPAHCELIGRTTPRRGQDGQQYAIRFHLRLPTPWNGRFFFQGGGGSNGVLGDALGNLQGEQAEVALTRGYAVVSQDSGHDNAVNNRPSHGGAAAFGWDAPARRDYAYASQARVAEISKALIARFYGRGPDFSYWVGCSKGGQEGMAMAERFPDSFNGIMANAPGFALPRAALAQAFDSRTFAAAATAIGARAADGLPLLSASFSDGDLGLVASGVTEACDALDGLRDGIVGDSARCTASSVLRRLKRHQCRGAKSADCLLPVQIDAMRRVMAGGRLRDGQPLYSDWAWDPGIGGSISGKRFTGWRTWKIGSDASRNDARNVLLGGASLPSVFLTPPIAVADTATALLEFQLKLDLDDAARAINATDAGFPESSWSMLAAQRPDRDAFRRTGGKMIVVHGVADPVFSFRDTARWWQAVDAQSDGAAATFVRLFAVPGMNHCRGGPATSRFDAFSALVDWVEHGVTPDRIVAAAPAETPWPGRTRPLCPYPQVARFTGGDPEHAGSFACSPGRSIR